ncbi:hypothetical protein BH09CHL1_BH09CHL1_11300 [soil metagenome]
MKILFLSHSVEGDAIKVGSHHLSREMARLGHDVAHVSTAISLPQLLVRRDATTRSRLSAARNTSKRDEFGRLNTSYIVPIPMQKHSQHYFFQRRLKQLGFVNADLVFIDQPLMNFVDCFHRAVVVYRPTDIHPDGAMRARERSIATACDGIVATSPGVLESLASFRADVPTMVLENGVDFAAFASSPSDSAVPRSGYVYVGAVDSRFDWQAIIVLAGAAPTERIDVFGPERVERPLLPSNVTVHGPIPYADLPRRLATYRVGLMPFNEHLLNEGRSPMKYYEYLSAGLFVLGKSTPELERRKSAGSFLYHHPSDIPDAVANLQGLQSPNEDGREIAESMNWRNRAITLLDFAARIKTDNEC